MFKAPPPLKITGSKISNLNEIREWANLNDPLWHTIETQAKIAGLSELELFQLLAAFFLKQNHELWTQLKANAMFSTIISVKG